MKPSETDNLYQRMARDHINEFLIERLPPGGRILEIGAENSMMSGADVETMNLLPGSTYQADITTWTGIESNRFDCIVCMEVLEHTVDPFDAMAEIRRLLKPGGLLLASAPMNFREHGPLPDCWRFTRHGWRVLLKNWDNVEIDALMTPDRFLMPLHINVSAICNKDKCVDPRKMTFPKETT